MKWLRRAKRGMTGNTGAATGGRGNTGAATGVRDSRVDSNAATGGRTRPGAARRNSVRWAEDKISRFEHVLGSGGCSIADIGAGRGYVSLGLMERGHDVTPVDVHDNSRIAGVQPVIYDGTRLPFADDSFDFALLLTVLHHTPDPDQVLREAIRIAPRLIVMEDTASSALKMRLTWWADSIANLEFRGHPHTNRSDAAWRAAFHRLVLRVCEVRTHRVFGFFTQTTYILERA